MRKNILSLLLLISSISFSQTPCTNGKAGTYPCNGYDLMANIPISTLANTNGTPRGNDIWGWTDSTTGKEYALVGTTNSTAFVDVSNPINPLFLGRLDSNARNNIWRDVKVYKDFAFIVADNVGAHGMQIFDLKKLRNVTTSQNFTADLIYKTDDLGSCHNVFVNEDTGVAYLVGCSNSNGQRLFNGGPIFVDVSIPLKPVKLGYYQTAGYSHDAQVITYNGPDTTYKGKEIYVGSNETKISILDVTDKTNVTTISEITYTQLGYTHQGWFTEDHKYFLLGDELDEKDLGNNTRTLIFDFSDLDNPKLSSTYLATTKAIDHNGYVKGNEFFIASYTAGMRSLSIANIASGDASSLSEIGYFDTYPANNNASFNGIWSVYPYFASGNIIISDIEKGLFIIKKTPAATNVKNHQEPNVSFAPNPMKTQTTIQLLGDETIKNIKIFNILGQKVLEDQNIEQSTYVLKKKQLKKGTYLVQINSKITRKLVIQ